MENLVCNLTGRVRREKLYDRDYLVAPATLIVPGVLNGSQGPLLYPPDEVADSAGAWDHAPIVVYHPKSGSAKTPIVLDGSRVGEVYDTVFRDGRLRADLWFDEKRTLNVDARIHDALINDRQIELSTGLRTKNERAPENSVYNAPAGPIPYTHIARSYEPDHVAVLPDQVGSCSISDGCGVLNATKTEGDENLPASAYAYAPYPDKPSTWKLRIDDVARVGGAIAAIGKGFRGQKVDLPKEAIPGVKKKIRAAWLKFHKDKSEKDLPNVLKNDAANTFNREDPNMAERAEMSDDIRKNLIGELIANSCCWEEEDRDELEAMTDNQLRRVKQAADKQTESELLIEAAVLGFNDGRDEITFNQKKKLWEKHTKDPPKEKTDVENETPSTLTEEGWLAQAPIGIQNTFAHAKEAADEEKRRLIDRIVVNVGDDARPEKVAFLSGKTIPDLREIASFMPPAQNARSQNYYAGQPMADAAANEKIDQSDGLEPLDIDWAENSVFAGVGGKNQD